MIAFNFKSSDNWIPVVVPFLSYVKNCNNNDIFAYIQIHQKEIDNIIYWDVYFSKAVDSLRELFIPTQITLNEDPAGSQIKEYVDQFIDKYHHLSSFL